MSKTTETYQVENQISNAKLNSLRAAVLGANDGVVSVSSIVMGVAGANADARVISLAGLAALIAGALSMAVGEYVSVSSQSDAEKAYIALEQQRLQDNPDKELVQLASEYTKLGLSTKTADTVARELTRRDALKAHLRIHFNLDPDDINSPWQAAIASLLAFTAGGLVPFVAVLISPHDIRVPVTVIAVIITLITIGTLSAKAGGARKARAVIRVVVGGVLAMAITYGVGVIFGTTVG